MMTDIPDDVWILRGKVGAAAALIKKAMRGQKVILNDFSEEEKKKGYGFGCQLVIQGEDGGVFLLCFSKDGLQPKPPEVAIRNTVVTDEDTLVSLATPDVSKLVVEIPDGSELSGLEAFVWLVDGGYQDRLPELRPIMTITEACANQKIYFSGNVPNVDMVEWQRIYNKALNTYAIPMIRDIMVQWAKHSKEQKEKEHGTAS